MPKYLVNYMGAKPGVTRPNLDAEGSKRFMAAWQDWASRHEREIVDGGAPVGKTLLVNGDGVSATQNAITGYTLVEAETHAAAAEIFIGHPHIEILGLSVEVMELPRMPGM